MKQLLNQQQQQAWESFVQDLRARARISVQPDLIGQTGA
jgi:hypothetical protein